MIDWNQVGGAATVGSAVITALRFLWVAIRKKFDAQDEARIKQLENIKTEVLTAFSKHEELDLERHADNIRKFERQDGLLTDIRLHLARAGLNGHAEAANE